MRNRFATAAQTTVLLLFLLAGGAAHGQVNLGDAPSMGGIRFAADAAAEPVMSGEGTVVVSYAVSYDELLFLKTDDGYRARYEITAILYDDGAQVAGDSWRREVRVDEYEKTNSRKLTIREELKLKVAPGLYRLKVELASLDTRSTGFVETTVEVSEISRDGLTLGPIVFESREVTDPDSSAVLDPAREYGEDNPVVRVRVPVYAEPGDQ